MQNKTLIALIAGFILYVLIGGAVFMALERQDELTRQEKAKNITKIFQALDIDCNSKTRVEEFALEAIEAYKNGLFTDFAEAEQHNIPPKWNYFSSFFFSFTAVTTIGYGNIAPTTDSGRLFCVIYALFGIPLCLVVTNCIGKKVSASIKRLNNCKWFRAYNSIKAKIVKGLLLFIPGFIFYIFVPVVVFTKIESWNYLESFYYVFVTLTTIGFGDYVPGQQEGLHELYFYRVMLVCWILFGLTFWSTICDIIFELIEKEVEELDEKMAELEEAAAAEDRQDKETNKRETEGIKCIELERISEKTT